MSDSPSHYRIGCNERGCQLCAVGWFVEYEYYVRNVENIRGGEKLRYLLEPAFRLSRGWGVIKNEWRDDKGSYSPFYHGRPVTMGEDLMFVLEDARQLTDSSHGKALTQAINKMIKFKGHLYNVHKRTDFECLGIPGPLGWFCRRNNGDVPPNPYDNPRDSIHGQHVRHALSPNSYVDSNGVELGAKDNKPSKEEDNKPNKHKEVIAKGGSKPNQEPNEEEGDEGGNKKSQSDEQME